MTYDQFFKQATGNIPYGYQCRLACGPDAHPDKPGTLTSGTGCQSQLISIPTGLGKTAAVVLAWLWNRRFNAHSPGTPQWPRRLVYCLPMRTLVEQTRDEVKKWLGDLLWDGKESHEGKIGLHILIGGEDSGEWDIYPECDAVLIGTQDMLLSRALNRGYGMSRYRWPMHFGLLNNDSLWVMDETQLMGVGVETSAQLAGFRAREEGSLHGKCQTWWMSATLEKTRLATVDHPAPADGWPSVELSLDETNGGRPHQLIKAKKSAASCSLVLNQTTKAGYSKELATLINARHREGTLTLVVVNRVKRAREVYEALTGGKKPLYDPARVALIHSRFRPMDRERHTKLLFDAGDRIVIATQAVEAGVDVSARLLVTELAPWSSLVQRIGRCNRQATLDDAEVLWIDIEPKDEKDELSLPYTLGELSTARTAMSVISNASPRILGAMDISELPVVRPVIRRRDLVDLFDTTPDICGQDLDISRYIRDGEDSDVQFFWRSIEGTSPGDTEAPPERRELCRVSIGDAAKFFAKEKTSAWLWNPLEREWQSAAKPRPGGVYLISVSSGGYEDELGWTGEPKTKKLTAVRPPQLDQEGHDRDADTFTRSWQTLADHTAEVVAVADDLTSVLAPEFAGALHAAALWHDVGKAHDEFQAMLRNRDAAREGTLWAKSGNREGRCSRRGFRHELGSALAWLLQTPADIADRDLIAYLIAAHHGKVRLSIRSLPEENGDPQDAERPFARGIWQGDKLPFIQLGSLVVPETMLDVSFMKMGEGLHGPSWLARTIALRDRIGPFRLAYLETLLRVADARASGKQLPYPNSESPVIELREEVQSQATKTNLSAAECDLVAELVADGLSIQERFRPEPLYKQTGQGHYEGKTVTDILDAMRAPGEEEDL